MSIINIAGLTPVDDPSYRYKMPRITAKVEGRGNGIKTVLTNVVEVAASLNREAPEVTKFFGCEIGSQTTYAADTDRAVVNGAHLPQDLQTHLSRYIENFVLCKQCHLPETVYKIKAGAISQQCRACGNKDAVDMTHKLTTFILAQRKKAKELAARSESKTEKKKKVKEEGAPATISEAAVLSSDPTAVTTKEKKVKKDRKVSSKKKAGDGDEECGRDTGSPTEADEEDTNERAVATCSDRLRLWRLDNAGAPLTAVLEELRILQTFSSLRVQDRVLIFLRSVFTEAIFTADEITCNAEMLALLAPNAIQQRHLIAGFEWLVGVHFPQFIKMFPVILKKLYEAELVEEDVFYAWATDSLRNEHTADSTMIALDTLEALKISAKLFITWLQEAEEEEEEDGEGEEPEEESENA